MEGSKHRTQISLEDWQYQMLRDLSRKTHKSLSAIIRDLVVEKFTKTPSDRRSDSLYGIVGLATGDGASVAREHDDYLYGKRK